MKRNGQARLDFRYGSKIKSLKPQRILAQSGKEFNFFRYLASFCKVVSLFTQFYSFESFFYSFGSIASFLLLNFSYCCQVVLSLRSNASASIETFLQPLYLPPSRPYRVRTRLFLGLSGPLSQHFIGTIRHLVVPHPVAHPALVM